MSLLLVIVIALLLIAAIAAFRGRGGRTYPPGGGFGAFGTEQRTQDAEAEARRLVDRLSGGITNLDGGGNPAATQALADAAERYSAALGELTRARTATQFALVSQTAVEGLHYIRAARVALGLDPGPSLPDLGTGQLVQSRQVQVGGQQYLGSPTPGSATPYYYPGGAIGGRPVPAGWYNTPWWKTALVAGAAGAGGMLLMDALFGAGGFGSDMGIGGFDGGGFDASGFDGGGFDWGGFDGF